MAQFMKTENQKTSAYFHLSLMPIIAFSSFNHLMLSVTFAFFKFGVTTMPHRMNLAEIPAPSLLNLVLFLP